MNGHMNGQANGTLKKPQPNGDIEPPIVRQRRSSSKTSAFGAVFSVTARLLLWYSVLTAVFRCPSSISDLTSTSPKICEPYLQLRAKTAPHLEPHYNAFLKPYVDQARPHIERFNEKVYAPAADFTNKNYGTYCAPRVARLQTIAGDAWSNSLKPRLETRRKWATEQYEKILSPHVNQVVVAAQPYISKVQEEMVDIYESTIVPLYERILPYLQQLYAQGHHITAEVVFPYIRSANRSTLSFLNRKVWPQLVILYGENVEPQLMKISERLGRYKDSKKLESAVDEISSTVSGATNSLSSILPSDGTAAATATPVKEKEVDTREKIESDLKTWQEKFAKAADKGAEDLQDRVKEITSRQAKSQAHGVGKALVVKLESAAGSAIHDVMQEINDIVKRLPENADEEDEVAAYNRILSSVRAAGTSIRDRAQAVRTWKQKYDQDTSALVHAALESTLKVIDNIRDLGLQEIGMRWAWMEGVTYKDWSKYHDLKSTFDEWRNEVETVALEHKGLNKAKEEGERVQEAAMETAEKAAKELTRLKDVARWKLDVRDSSPDFTSRVIPAKAKKVAQQVVNKVKEATEGPAGPSASGMESVATQASSVLENAKDSVFDATNAIGSSLSGVVHGSQGTAEGLGSDATSKASEISENMETRAESVLSAAKKKTVEASSAVIGTPAPQSGSILSDASSNLESVSSGIADEASTASKKVLGGAMAAKVEAKQIILDNDFVDDDLSVSERIQSMVSIAGDKATDLTNAVSEALRLKPTETQGTAESMASLAGAQYEKAMSAASSALYGTTPGAVESLSSVAADKYAHAVTAASYAIYGTPAPVLQSLASQASAQYDEAIIFAKEQFSKASLAIVGSPKPAYEKTLSSIDLAYSDSLAAASAKLQSALAHTASITNLWAKPTQGTFESVSSVASARLQQALEQASSQYENAKVAIGAQPTPAHQRYLAEAQKQYYQGVGLAHDQYSRFLSTASSAVYGPPKPAYESLLSGAQAQYTAAVAEASSRYDQVLSSASSVAGKTKKSPAQTVIDSASSQYEIARSKASEAFAAASSAIAEGPHGKQKYEYLLSHAKGRYSSAVLAASSNLNDLRASASSAVGKKSKSGAEKALETASSQYNAAVSAASEILAAASSSASAVIYGTPTGNVEYLASVASENLLGKETPWTEAAASQASANWESLVSKASEQIYGTPTPWHESAWSQAGDYAAQATGAAGAQYTAVQALINDLIIGKEPDFTESVLKRLSSAYYTGMAQYASSASSGAGEAYSSASSVVVSVFTPPPSLEAILDNASNQLNSAVEAASIQIYGTKPGTIEKAASAAAGAYGSAKSKASEAIYGTRPSYAEAAQASFADVASNAQSALSVAIYGSPTGTVEAATKSAASMYSSVSSVAAENLSVAGDAMKDSYAAASAKVSEAIYGPEQGAMESAVSRISAALESARARLSSFAEGATGAAAEQLKDVKSSVEELASSVDSAASSATSKVRDEL